MTPTTAKELSNRLKYLVLVGQDCDGELEFMGTPEDWEKVDNE